MDQCQIKYNKSIGYMPKTALYTLIAGLTRNLPSNKDSSSCLGDGGCSSAMRVKSAIVTLFSLKSHVR